jgi:hypothetical protein
VVGGERGFGERPGATVADDDELVILEREAGLLEASRADRDLDVVVRAGPPAEEEVDRPAARDAPWRRYGSEALRYLGRRPRVPAREVRDEASVLRELAQFQRLQR